MNNDLLQEMTVVLTNEKYDENEQIKVNAQLGRFLNCPEYMKKVTDKLNSLIDKRNIDFASEFSEIIYCVIELNKHVISVKNEISKKNMKFVVYGIIYDYLDKHQPKLLNSLDQGVIRIAFINAVQLLLENPKNIKVQKQSLLDMIKHCIWGDNFIRI